MKLSRNLALRFVVCFAFWYAALLFSWPITGQAYCATFRAVGTLIYGRIDRNKEITFEAYSQGWHSHYTRVVIVNPAKMKPDGSGPVRNLDLDTRAFGWMPLALLLALVLATPLPWKRRGRALLWGFIFQQTFVILALGYCIWNESTEVGLVSLSEPGKEAAAAVKNMLAGQLTAAVPVLIWILTTFRREDLQKISEFLTEKKPNRSSKIIH
jgi:hypothetical protein